MILGIDGGNNEVKVWGPKGAIKFPSDMGEFRDLNLKNSLATDDIIWEYLGNKGFAGTLAQNESEYSGVLMGDSKAHDEAKLRILLAIHRYCLDYPNVQIVVGQPIGKHMDSEKDAIKGMLIGGHDITVNGVRKHIDIRKVEVAAEGGAAFWIAPEMGTVRIIDVGGGTINFATLKERRYIDRDSFTLPFGMKTGRLGLTPQAFTRTIALHALKKWNKEDNVRVIGGAAERICGFLTYYFPNAKVSRPIHQGVEAEPVYANAAGFYEIAQRVFHESR